MRMLEGIDTRTEMVMDVDQVGDLRGVILITLVCWYTVTFGDKVKEFITLNEDKSKKDSKKN